MEAQFLYNILVLQSTAVIVLSIVLLMADRKQLWKWAKLLYIINAFLALFVATQKFKTHYTATDFFLYLMAFQAPYLVNLVISFASHRINGGVISHWSEFFREIRKKLLPIR